MSKANKKVLLRDLTPISPQEFEKAQEICQKIRRICDLREDFIQQHNLDPEIAFPQANWATEGENNYLDLYELVSKNPQYEIINNLKFYAYSFTGYYLGDLASLNERPPKQPFIPDRFDELWEQQTELSDAWIERYEKMVAKVPANRVAIPRKLGEVGVDLDGITVSHDVAVYQERLNLLSDAGILDELRDRIEQKGSVNIVEIGGGYGGLAYFIKQVLPQCNYWICDLPESLLFSALYLSLACPETPALVYDGSQTDRLSSNSLGFQFIPNFMFDDFIATQANIDLAINTLSFSEMSEKQVRYYGSGLSKVLGNTGKLFEQNQDNRHLGFIYCKNYLYDYFKVRRFVQPKSMPGSTQGVTDVWSNCPQEAEQVQRQITIDEQQPQQAQAAIEEQQKAQIIINAQQLQQAQTTIDEQQQQLQQAQIIIEEQQQQLQQAQITIEAMKSSKFWKLRSAWFKFKKAVGLPIK